MLSNNETLLLDEFEAANLTESADFFSTMQTTGALLGDNYVVAAPVKPTHVFFCITSDNLNPPVMFLCQRNLKLGLTLSLRRIHLGQYWPRSK